MRGNVPHSEGPSLADLANSGIKVDTLQQLMPKESLKQLIPYDQLVVRGEDLSRLIFAQLPAKSVEQLDGTGDGARSDKSGREDQETRDSVPVWLVVLSSDLLRRRLQDLTCWSLAVPTLSWEMDS